MTATLVELFLPELPFDPSHVGDPTLYQVTSLDDPDFVSGVQPIAVEERYAPDEAPYRPAMLASGGDIAHITVVYRIYLRLAAPLKAGHAYTVTMAPSVVATGPFVLTYDASPTEAIHVNQVAYQADLSKVAYVSWWTGQGSAAVTATQFQVIDESSGGAVYTGTVAPTTSGDANPWSKSAVYALDFSAFQTPGTYHLEVPGIGRSYAFKVSSTAFAKDVGYTVFRGLFMQRDGNHGLDRADLTHFNRPPAHLSDAIDEWTGRSIALVGGHMDAGDRGHYPHNSAEACANLLTPTFFFGPQIDALGESLDLPETGNGIPDYLDELTYELDWLAAAVNGTSRDGTLGFALRPSNFGYELGQPATGATNRVFFNRTYGALRSETLYAAGALAMACNSPPLKKYLSSAKLSGYQQAALRAFGGFELHNGDDGYWKDGAGWYDPWDPTKQAHMWSDEMVFAAANLLQLTSDPKYVAWIGKELPVDLDGLRQWGWVTTGPWLHAFVSLANVTDPQLDATTKARARGAVVSWAEAEVGSGGVPYDAPFGVPYPSSIRARVGWYFTNTFASMAAYGLTGDPTYRDRIAKSWNYLLGTNAASRSFYSGLGDVNHRPHWLTHEISYDAVSRYANGDATGWVDVAPGLPMADVQMGIYPSYYADAWNAARRDQRFPAWSGDYPVLYRATDAWDTGNEFAIDKQTRQVASLVPVLTSQPPAGTSPPPSGGGGGAVLTGLVERSMAAPPDSAPKATVLDRDWIQLYLPEHAFASSTVNDNARYTISSPDDPAYATGAHPASVQARYFPESATYATTLGASVPARLQVAYRVYLHLGTSLTEGKTYGIEVDPAVVANVQFTTRLDPATPNEAFHVNQVEYEADASKVAYLSAWTGQGSIDYAHAGTFALIDESTGEAVFTGPVTQTASAAQEPWSRSNVFALDFSSVTTEGRYHLYASGVGASYSFGIKRQAFNDVGYTVFRGLTALRDGNHGLDAGGFTHWARPAAHTDTSIDERNSALIDLVGGHMLGIYDVNRGHRPWNSAHGASSLLSAIAAYPNQVVALGESLQIPESGNGIPDVLDEVIYELDWLAKIVNAGPSGAVAVELSPANHARELYVAPAGLRQREWWSVSGGLSRSATLYVAGALAQAYDNPLIQEYAPAKAAAYLSAAQSAWSAFQANATNDSYWKDDANDLYRSGTHVWSDELLVAAAYLLQATGDPSYVSALTAALPSDMTKSMMRWTWVTDGPWLNAWYGIAQCTSPNLDPSIVTRARAAIAAWGDEALGHDGALYATPFGGVLNFHVQTNVTQWYTPSATDFALTMAYAVTGASKYRTQLVKDWNATLGTNALSRTFVSGLGDPTRSPRWMVNEIAQYQWAMFNLGDTVNGWKEPPPGLPSADVQDGNFAWYFNDAWNAPRVNLKMPAVDGNYPALYRYNDAWNRGADIGFDQAARGAASLLPLVALP
ncbi:MAG TPA: glycoside hydrolase family 9 protein [Polyangiaceae bacterium]|jgi:hypothetical protein